MTGTRHFYLAYSYFTFGIIMLIVICFSFYKIGETKGIEQELWRSYLEQKACSDALEQVKLSQKELEMQYDASLEALNISNQYNDNQTSLIIGRSYSDKFYVVITQGLNASEISNNEDHEICHQLVKRDKEHFC